MESNRLSPYSTLSATREVLERHGLFAKYALGQNFLVNDDVIRKIIELADVQPADCILEVGPGIGTLTAALLPRSRHVIAIEKDRDLVSVLDDTLAPWKDKFTLVSADALAVTEEQVGKRGDSPSAQSEDAERGEQTPGLMPPNKLVSNLPYAVAATVVLDYLQRFDFLESLTVMVQKEVADRMTALPNTKAYGAYTAKLSFYARPVGRFPVSPGSFFPQPHVDSAVLRLERIEPLADASVIEAACLMADAVFATRRKTLANSCKTFFASEPDIRERLPEIFQRAGIDPRRRGETLSTDDFLSLADALIGITAR